jgi:hypothetical protein
VKGKAVPESAVVRRLTSAEARAYEARLKEAQTPSEVKSLWHEVAATTDAFMIVQPEISSFMRDAFVAYTFAELVGAEKVWLAADPPDFGVRFSGGRENFYEVTCSDLPGRKMSDVYKKTVLPERIAGTEEIKSDPDFTALCFSMTAEIASETLSASAAKKVRKDYDPSWGLVVLLNPSCAQSEISKIEAILSTATECAKDTFSEVWVLWKNRLYQTWQNGQPCALSPTVRDSQWDGVAFEAVFGNT